MFRLSWGVKNKVSWLGSQVQFSAGRVGNCSCFVSGTQLWIHLTCLETLNQQCSDEMSFIITSYMYCGIPPRIFGLSKLSSTVLVIISGTMLMSARYLRSFFVQPLQRFFFKFSFLFFLTNDCYVNDSLWWQNRVAALYFGCLIQEELSFEFSLCGFTVFPLV